MAAKKLLESLLAAGSEEDDSDGSEDEGGSEDEDSGREAPEGTPELATRNASVAIAVKLTERTLEIQLPATAYATVMP